MRALNERVDDKGHFIVDCFVQVAECGQQLDTAGHAVLQQDNRRDAGVIALVISSRHVSVVTITALHVWYDLDTLRSGWSQDISRFCIPSVCGPRGDGAGRMSWGGNRRQGLGNGRARHLQLHHCATTTTSADQTQLATCYLITHYRLSALCSV